MTLAGAAAAHRDPTSSRVRLSVHVARTMARPISTNSGVTSTVGSTACSAKAVARVSRRIDAQGVPEAAARLHGVPQGLA